MTSTQTQWIIRPATLEDKDAVQELLERSYETLLAPDYDAQTLRSALPVITIPRQELLTCGTWYLVQDPKTDQLVGCGGWTKGKPNDDDTAAQETYPHLRHFATHPMALRRGIGRTLWHKIWNDVEATLGPDTTLEVYSTLTATLFYESIGFEVMELLDLPISLSSGQVNFPCVVMRRDPQKHQC
jgi:ribosomal protein S18 acetylase RimI-like enzyme